MINFSNVPGNCFNALGAIGYLAVQSESYQTTLLGALIGGSGITAQLLNQPDISANVGQNYLDLVNNPGSNIGSFAQTMAGLVLNRIVFDDYPQINQSLTQVNIPASIAEVIRQMNVQGATIQSQTVGSTINQFSNFPGNIGNGAVLVSLIRPEDGKFLENAFAETLTAYCSQDSYIGGATAGNELFQVNGESAANVFDQNWPLGSGLSTAINAVDGTQNNGTSGNLLNNSGFDVWSSGLPTNWTFVTGSGLVAQQTSIVFNGAASLQVTGDGSTNLNFYQTFNSQNTSTLQGIVQYGTNIWLRRGGLATTGIMVIDLVDQNLNVTSDAGGRQNTFTIDLSTLSTIWSPFNVAFRTPLALPSSQSIRIRTTTAINNGGLVYMDDMCFSLMNQLLPSCPYMTVFSGGVPFAQGDYAQAIITNGRGPGGTLTTFQTVLFQLFYPLSFTSEVIWPSNSSPSISDALIA